jgi:hypothetical protein
MPKILMLKINNFKANTKKISEAEIHSNFCTLSQIFFFVFCFHRRFIQVSLIKVLDLKLRLNSAIRIIEKFLWKTELFCYNFALWVQLWLDMFVRFHHYKRLTVYFWISDPWIRTELCAWISSNFKQLFSLSCCCAEQTDCLYKRSINYCWCIQNSGITNLEPNFLVESYLQCELCSLIGHDTQPNPNIKC